MTNKTDSRILLLFDIDGTLILTGGVAGRLMIKAAEEEIRRHINFDTRVFIGSTDRLIIHTFLKEADYPEPEIKPAIDRILDRYLDYIQKEFVRPGIVQVLPGVKQLLDTAAQDSRFALGLLTGNIYKGARTKLAPVGLNEYFPVGAFGDDNMDRNHLPPVALWRASRYYNTEFTPENAWIIGDSPKDILCAQTHRLRVMAVATGRPTFEELSSCNPDIVVPDLQNVNRILEIFRMDGKSIK